MADDNPTIFDKHNTTTAEDIKIMLRDRRIILGLLSQKPKEFFGDELESDNFKIFITGYSGVTNGVKIRSAHPYAVERVIIQSSSLGEMKDIVYNVKAVSREGEQLNFRGEELSLGYRQSIFQKNNCAICEVELRLERGECDSIKSKMNDFTERRESKQPLEMPSAGSTFKRPKGYFAGTLIDKTGLKGLKVGGAMVSEKHAGFVVNAGGATAADVLNLIEEVKRRVREAHGVILTPEVRIIGE